MYAIGRILNCMYAIGQILNCMNVIGQILNCMKAIGRIQTELLDGYKASGALTLSF